MHVSEELAGSYANDAPRCHCGRRLDGLYRCPCETAADPPRAAQGLVPACKYYPPVYLLAAEPVGIPQYDLERARAYARKWGGTLVLRGGSREEYPLPAWLAALMPAPGRRPAPDAEWRHSHE